MSSPIKLGAAALAGVIGIGSIGAVAAIGENAIDPVRPEVSVSADLYQTHAEMQTQADEAAAIEFAGALHEQRVEDYALLVYLNKVEEAEAAAAAAAAEAAAQAATPVYSGGGAGGHLASIRACESGGNYGAVSPSGQYRGAYQFDYQTWASVGGSGDPAAASPGEQDMRAQMLMDQRGSSPWPVCG